MEEMDATVGLLVLIVFSVMLLWVRASRACESIDSCALRCFVNKLVKVHTVGGVNKTQ